MRTIELRSGAMRQLPEFWNEMGRMSPAQSIDAVVYAVTYERGRDTDSYGKRWRNANVEAFPCSPRR